MTFGGSEPGATGTTKMTAEQENGTQAEQRLYHGQKRVLLITIKYARRNHEMMRIRNYRIEADEKRHMRRLYPEVAFDWKKITQQLAEKREACRRYRSRRRNPDTAGHPRGREPLLYGVYAPGTRTVYVNDVPSSAAGVGALLDAVLRIDRGLKEALPPPGTDSREDEAEA